MSLNDALSNRTRVVAFALATVAVAILSGCPSANFVTVPNVVGMQQAAAEAAITAAGLTVGTVTPQSYGAAIGEVFQQDPSAGSTVVPMASIDIWVSTGFDLN